MAARELLSRQIEETQRVAQETRNVERNREREMLSEKAKGRDLFAEKTARLKAIRLAKEATDKKASLQAAATKLAASPKKSAKAKASS